MDAQGSGAHGHSPVLGIYIGDTFIAMARTHQGHSDTRAMDTATAWAHRDMHKPGGTRAHQGQSHLAHVWHGLWGHAQPGPQGDTGTRRGLTPRTRSRPSPPVPVPVPVLPPPAAAAVPGPVRAVLPPAAPAPGRPAEALPSPLRSLRSAQRRPPPPQPPLPAPASAPGAAPAPAPAPAPAEGRAPPAAPSGGAVPARAPPARATQTEATSRGMIPCMPCPCPPGASRCRCVSPSASWNSGSARFEAVEKRREQFQLFLSLCSSLARHTWMQGLESLLGQHLP